MKRNPVVRPRQERGSIIVIALLLMVLLSLLGVTLLTVASTEHSMAFNALNSEGALTAAEAGVNQAISQLSSNAQTSMQAIPVTDVGPSWKYRSGRRTDAAPQALTFVGSRTEAGYSLAVGTGYNPSGFAFHRYQVNSTGCLYSCTALLKVAREVEVQAEYGPVAQ
jgi:hypothetical protein